MKFYHLSEVTFEDYDLGDFVYNYFHNSEAVIPGIIIDMVLFCVDIKRKINNKNISFSKGYKEVSDVFGNFIGVVLDDRLNPKEIEFFSNLLSFIPDSSIKD